MIPWLVLGLSSVPAWGADAPPPFSCTSPAAVDRSPQNPPQWGVDGVVLVEVLEDGALRVQSIGGNLGELAVLLGSTLGKDLVVDARIGHLPVSLFVEHGDLEAVLELLQVEYGVHSSELDGALLLESLETFQQRIWVAEPTELTRRLFEVPKDVPAAHAAQAYCHHVAGVRGRATVVGDRVLVEDRTDRLAAFEVLVIAMDGL